MGQLINTLEIVVTYFIDGSKKMYILNPDIGKTNMLTLNGLAAG